MTPLLFHGNYKFDIVKENIEEDLTKQCLEEQ